MKAQDLRVGNWYNHNGKMYKVTPTIIEEVWISERSWCKPIPLTEEILLKCGFKRLGKDTFYLGSIKIHHRKRGFVIAKRYVDILYLHQLQNLYFALTGEELNIEL